MNRAREVATPRFSRAGGKTPAFKAAAVRQVLESNDSCHLALTPQRDRVHYAEAANGYWTSSRIRNVRVPREGHCYHIRSAGAFNEEITAFAS